MTPTVTPDHTDSPASLWGREHRALTLGAFTLVTIGACEARSVTTLLPAAATEVDGLAWFGLTSSLPGLAAVAALPALGHLTDRRGPAPVVLAGLVGLVLATMDAALAPSWWVLMVGRVLSGLADGVFAGMTASAGAVAVVAAVAARRLR
ncbi:MFS transporter [Kytococcus sedentarius]|uniref:MFS transporter n=1 Tax=Kytococcus sedentarius TaxID=1276 RepID=UPI00194EAB5F|nr:MFS transporter [Kytococcus sedentarius]QRO87003.1 MFS transporter [Kytococcus sedentarius]